VAPKELEVETEVSCFKCKGSDGGLSHGGVGGFVILEDVDD